MAAPNFFYVSPSLFLARTVKLLERSANKNLVKSEFLQLIVGYTGFQKTHLIGNQQQIADRFRQRSSNAIADRWFLYWHLFPRYGKFRRVFYFSP